MTYTDTRQNSETDVIELDVITIATHYQYVVCSKYIVLLKEESIYSICNVKL